MTRYRLALGLAALGLGLLATLATASERKIYDAADFAAAQQAGSRILIDISATWCPTCKAQKPIIEGLSAQPENADLIIYDVDFDSMKDVVRAFGARMQSTLIAFAGSTETARSVGDTDPQSIGTLIMSNAIN